MIKTTIETWKEIPLEGNEGKYYISTLGRVFNKETGNYVAQVLTGEPQYFYVNLKLTQKRVLRRVHNLMCRAFKDNPDKLKYVDHIDQNKYNNCLDNLRWVCRKGNANNTSSNVYINGRKVEEYVRTLTDDEQVIKSSVVKIYRDKLYTECDAKEVVNYFTNRERLIEDQKRETKLRYLMRRSFSKSMEFNGMWFPDMKTLCEHYDMNPSSFKNYSSQCLGDDMVISLSSNKWKGCKVYNYRGVIGNLEHLIKEVNPYITVSTFMGRRYEHGWSFEDALTRKPTSLRNYYYKRVKYKLKKLCEVLDLNYMDVNKHVSGFSYTLIDYCIDRDIEEAGHITLLPHRNPPSSPDAL